jgi:hypothetical protein
MIWLTRLHIGWLKWRSALCVERALLAADVGEWKEYFDMYYKCRRINRRIDTLWASIGEVSHKGQLLSR